MFYWIYDIPNWQVATLVCSALCLFGCGGTVVTRPFVRRWIGPQSPTNDLVSYFMSAYGVFYGLMLGLIAVGTYENFTQIEESTAKEASALGAVYQDVSNYPEPLRSELRSKLREQCQFVIEKAWPSQKKGEVNDGGTPIILAFERQLLAFEPQNKALDHLHAETLRQYNALLELRRMRFNSVTTGLPATLWYVVVIGAMLNLVLCWFFSFDQLGLHLLLVAILATFIGLVIFLIAAMDNPFRGEFCVSPEPFEMLLNSLKAAP